MRRLPGICVALTGTLIALFVLALECRAQIDAPAEVPEIARQLVVVHRPTPSGVDPQAIARTLGARHRDSRSLTALRLTISVFDLDWRADLAAIEAALRASLDVLAMDVSREYVAHASGFELSARSLQYAIELINARDTSRFADGRGVRVALIDGGIDDRHVALKGKFLAHIDLVGEATSPQPSFAYDELRHGTGVAGIVLASGAMIGLAPGARAIAIKAFSLRGGDGKTIRSSSERIARAIEIALRLRARVINMSFAGPRDRVVEFVVGAALAEGAILVAAAGSAAAYPAAYHGVIGVAAVDAAEQRSPVIAARDHIAVLAPGVDVLTAAPGGGFQTLSGASLAAAHVSGAAALLVELRPTLDARDVLAILRRTARPPRNVDAPGDDGGWIVDVGAALASLGDAAGGRPPSR